MKKVFLILFVLVVSLSLILPVLAQEKAPAEKAQVEKVVAKAKKLSKKDPITWVADTRGEHGKGVWGWSTAMYNENIYAYALFSIAVMVAMGYMLGTLSDIVMGMTGIDLKTRKLRE
ncbi:MAG: hypothetical protein OEZ31_05705 [Nitrospirota bacterium]|nr:hypothetical protein [Nitrospirota bacterium]MDH5768437.1 hypothetical protein [Nitrospirota bacterium]